MQEKVRQKAAIAIFYSLSISQLCGLNNAFSDYRNKKRQEQETSGRIGRLKRDVFAVYESILKAFP